LTVEARPRRRSGVPWAGLALFGVSLGLAGVVAWLGYLHLTGGAAGNASEAVDLGPSIPPPGESADPRRRDPRPVVAPPSARPAPRAIPRGRSLGEDLGGDFFSAAGPPDVPPEPAEVSGVPATTDNGPAQTATTGQAAPTAGAASENTSAEPAFATNPDRITRADQAIERLATALRSGDLAALPGLTEQAVGAAVTPEQDREADSLRQFAELAAYYQGAVDRSLGGLQAGDSIDLTPALKISFVEIGDERLVIRSGGRNKRYAKDEIPIVLIDRLATTSLQTAGATGLAAKACFHAVSPRAGRPDDRRQALGWLESIQSDIVGADRNDLIDVMETWLTD